MIVESFIKECLDEPTRVQEKHIDVKGMLKDKSNKIESFCVRPYDMHDDTFSQTLSSKSNADKMVFAFDECWIILDVNEIKKFYKLKQNKKIMFEDLYDNTDWIIKIKRNDKE